MKRAVPARVSTLLHRAQWRVAAFSLICASLLLTVAGLYALREYEARSMELVARALAIAGEPALRFNDRPAMRELIDNLAAAAQLAEVDIVDRLDHRWLSYQRPEGGTMDRCARGLARWLMRGPTSAQVGDAATPLGHIALRSDGQSLLRFIGWSALSFLMCALATLLVARSYSHRLASLIVNPIDALATLTREVRESRSFDRRAEHAAVREIDALADDFNTLLIEMQVKQALIEAHHADLERSNETLRRLSRYDSLTQLPNRAYLSEHLDEVLHDARAHGHQAGLVFIDTDRFKQVNDRFGHAAGDAVLIELSKRLRSSTRDSDFVARLGGDEFIIVISPLRDAQEIARLTDRIQRSLDRPVQLPGSDAHAVSVTMGVAVFPDHADTTANLIKAADEAMYRAKAIGPGSVRTFQPGARKPDSSSKSSYTKTP
jgi:diguanylate cyclase